MIARHVRHHRPALLLLALILMGVLLAPTGAAQAATADYIVMLRPGVSLTAHLKAMKITPNRLYTSATTGYAAVLNDTQYKRVLASTDTTIVTPNVVVATLPPSRHRPPDLLPSRRSSLRAVSGGSGLLPAPLRPSTASTLEWMSTSRWSIPVSIAHDPDLNVVGGVDCVGKNAQGNNGAFVDKTGHGTMVLGIVGAIDNTIGAVGVAPGDKDLGNPSERWRRAPHECGAAVRHRLDHRAC